MSDTPERVHIEDGPKRVRTYIGGELIADTKRLKLVWEFPYYPAYYFPPEDVRMELLTPNGHTRRSPSRGDAHNFTVKVGDREVEVNGVKIADTRRPTLLFETRLPTRYYMPKPRRAHGPAHSNRHRHRLRVQGLRQILVRQCWRRDGQGSGLVVQDDAPRERQDRRAGCVLQRAGRLHRGRRTTGATKDQVLVSVASDVPF